MPFVQDDATAVVEPPKPARGFIADSPQAAQPTPNPTAKRGFSVDTEALPPDTDEAALYANNPSPDTLKAARDIRRAKLEAPMHPLEAAGQFAKGFVKGIPSAVKGFGQSIYETAGNVKSGVFGSGDEQQRAGRQLAATVQAGAMHGAIDLPTAIKRNAQNLYNRFTGRKLTDDEIDEQLQFDAGRHQVAQEIQTGHLQPGTLVSAADQTESPEDLAASGHAIRPEEIDRASWIADPAMLALGPAAEAAGPLIGRTIAAPLLKGAGRGLEALGGAAKFAAKRAEPFGYLDLLWHHNPLALGATYGAKAAAKYVLPKVGGALRETGEEAAGAAPREGQGLIEKSFKQGAKGAVTGATLAAPFAAGAQTPEQAGEAFGGGFGIGAALGAGAGIKGSRDIDVAAVHGRMAREGAAINYGTPEEQIHAAWMQALPEPVRDLINVYRARFNGMAGKDGEPIQIYASGGKDYADAIQQNKGHAPTPEEAASRGFVSDDGTKVFINAEAGKGEAPWTLGHEAGGHVSEFLADTAKSHDLATLREKLKAELYRDGKPIPQFAALIRGYKRAIGDTTSVDQTNPEQFESEFLAEHAGNILKGGNIANFQLPAPLTERLTRGASKWLRDNGVLPQTGDKLNFGADEIKNITDAWRELLYRQGNESEELRRARMTDASTKAQTPASKPADSAQATQQSAPDQTEMRSQVRAALHRLNVPQAAQWEAAAKGNTVEEILADALRQRQAAKTPAQSTQPPTAGAAPVPATTTPQPTAPIEKAPSPQGQPVPQQPSSPVATLAPPVQEAPKPEQTRPALPRREEVDAIVEDAENKAVAQEKNTRTDAAQERIYSAKVNAIMDAIDKHGGTGLHRVTDEAGNTKITGDFDIKNPLHAALVDLAGGITEQADKNLQALQADKGATNFIRYRSAKSQTEATPWKRIGMTQRRGEYVEDPAAGRTEGTIQHKAIIPLTTVFKGGRPQQIVFTLDNLLHNAESVKQFMQSKGMKFPYPDEQTLVRDAKVYADNHQHGWTGDGRAPMQGFPDSDLPTPDLNYKPETIPEDRFQALNLLMHNEDAGKYADRIQEVSQKQKKVQDAKTDKERQRLQGVLERSTERMKKSEEAFALADQNLPKGWIDPNTGESNALRAKLKAAGFNTGDALKSPFETLDPQHILAMDKQPIPMEPGDIPTVRPTGFDMGADNLSPMGRLNSKAVSAGFLPSNPKESAINTDKGEVTPKGLHFLPAHHGTPHEVDRFSTDKIGTGEGAQVYGHGLYFAENQKVAEEYQRVLSSKTGNLVKQVESATGFKLPDGAIRTALEFTSKGDTEQQARRAQYASAELRSLSPPEVLQVAKAARQAVSGNIYTVDLDAEPEHLLDYDKPLNQQSKEVMDALGSFAKRGEAVAVLKEGGDVGQFYAALVRDTGSPQQASDYLKKLGIPGIQYLDQGSRVSSKDIENTRSELASWKQELEYAKANKFSDHAMKATEKQVQLRKKELDEMERKQREGTRNFVIFDDSKIKITHKNGEPVDIKTAFMPEPVKPVKDDQIYNSPGQQIEAGETGLPTGYRLERDGALWIAYDDKGKRVAATGSRQGTIQQANDEAETFRTRHYHPDSGKRITVTRDGEGKFKSLADRNRERQ